MASQARTDVQECVVAKLSIMVPRSSQGAKGVRCDTAVSYRKRSYPNENESAPWVRHNGRHPGTHDESQHDGRAVLRDQRCKVGREAKGGGGERQAHCKY